LSNLYEKIENVEGHLFASRKIESIYNQIFGPTDPRVLKFKRTLALLLLDNEAYEDSLKELYELEVKKIYFFLIHILYRLKNEIIY
jgi:hypothetical protein